MAHIPTGVWNSVPQEDKNEFQRLKAAFHLAQKTSSKDPRLVAFSNELHTIIGFIDRSNRGHEGRCIISGVAFAGPFICINTRQLRDFLGRCKSSINGSLQQLGYVAIKTKSKARSCLLAVMPSLVDDQNNLRQWTVRYASHEAKFCFVTSVRHLQLPLITEDDLNDEHRPPEQAPPVRHESAPVTDMSSVLSSSYSVECFTAYGNEPAQEDEGEWNPMMGNKTMKRSKSFYEDSDGDVFSFQF